MDLIGPLTLEVKTGGSFEFMALTFNDCVTGLVELLEMMMRPHVVVVATKPADSGAALKRIKHHRKIGISRSTHPKLVIMRIESSLSHIPAT